MNHIAVEQFRERYDDLPLAIRRLTDKNFSIIKEYPDHPLLRLLRIEEFVSMRIGSRHRALAFRDGNRTVWFWIGTYAQYKHMVE